jgi:hypothetical protein
VAYHGSRTKQIRSQATEIVEGPFAATDGEAHRYAEEGVPALSLRSTRAAVVAAGHRAGTALHAIARRRIAKDRATRGAVGAPGEDAVTRFVDALPVGADARAHHLFAIQAGSGRLAVAVAAQQLTRRTDGRDAVAVVIPDLLVATARG